MKNLAILKTCKKTSVITEVNFDYAFKMVGILFPDLEEILIEGGSVHTSLAKYELKK